MRVISTHPVIVYLQKLSHNEPSRLHRARFPALSTRELRRTCLKGEVSLMSAPTATYGHLLLACSLSELCIDTFMVADHV